ncbi:FAD-dependent oxidoreductase [Demequina lutea]|uniref:Pyruvate/2-oxoglutarate dehydrogenase complex dihydrolipoamide dehydrogenase (E3) component n=1 Tax=Demequina lutea TaxID=431489 RepID=A0A7Y9ZA10_9MICO|nr:FAD-dependent oxidoreductase [Demequina lutea]NYI40255.1 pyruvate/2-oxoglutarate dehydrogenase complex dihydrolipoamide dehydrogenase (E3) component [Demequina lutea]
MALHHTQFDTIVIGGGQAGPSLASKLDARGEKVAVFQEGPFGGTCLNDGCRPTKALRASAHAAHAARTAAPYGVHVDGVTVNVAEAVDRKDSIIGAWRDGATDYYENHETISYVTARARLTGKDGDNYLVTFGDKTVTAPRIILNPGARSVPPPIEGLDAVDFLDHHTLLDLKEAPGHLVVIGGSYIGLELGQVWSRFGSKVTILEHGEHIISREDTDVSDAIAAMLRDEGLDVRTGVTIDRVEADGGGAVVVLGDGERLSCDRILVAAGRIPNSDDLGLATVGVATDKRGYITTDEHFLTSAPGIFAVGDVNGRGAFTHTSYQDHEILADHLAGGDRTVAGRIPTYALFTDPPLGRVGMTEAQARAAGVNITVSNYEMASVTRAALDGITPGMIRLVVDADADRLVGAAIFGLHGDEVIQALSLLMHVDAPASALATWLPIHPTVAEFLPTIYGGLEPA